MRLNKRQQNNRVKVIDKLDAPFLTTIYESVLIELFDTDQLPTGISITVPSDDAYRNVINNILAGLDANPMAYDNYKLCMDWIEAMFKENVKKEVYKLILPKALIAHYSNLPGA